MNNTGDNGEQGNNQNAIRLGIVLLVIVVVIGSVMIMGKHSDEEDIDMKYVGAVVSWQDENNIQIVLINSTDIYNIRVIGLDEENDHEVILSNTSSFEVNNITFDLTDMIDDDMGIWIEVENANTEIKETIRWM
ncbi:hypothetical protein KAU43_04195 [candidate division WOR-3 bacterium]|nr:hypothetical protein [candidate division WOR-3 bacterium]